MIDMLIFLAALIIGAVIIYWLLKGILKVALWALAIFVAYVILKLFIFK